MDSCNCWFLTPQIQMHGEDGRNRQNHQAFLEKGLNRTPRAVGFAKCMGREYTLLPVGVCIKELA